MLLTVSLFTNLQPSAFAPHSLSCLQPRAPTVSIALPRPSPVSSAGLPTSFRLVEAARPACRRLSPSSRPTAPATQPLSLSAVQYPGSYRHGDRHRPRH